MSQRTWRSCASSRWERDDFATAEAFDAQVEFARIMGAGDLTGASGRWRGIDELWAGVAEWFQPWEEVRLGAARLT